ncbi:thiamine-phosphate synthase [Echinicola pacifica]|uniref:Thiamine-phosphate synthase n=1 Tax=Echinicola pacifica TaxID=346377 RepID=A0A918PNJ1_9BACT|nr:thiamine phosphate synthase [Echinicola pacifica]GGZ17324.1 thiamine-phosphate synthase [Echinicola pacifica]
MISLIAISAPDAQPNEVQTFISLLEVGLHRLHIRRPDWTKQELIQLFREIPEKYFPQISLHGHHEIVSELSLGGRHYKGHQQPKEGKEMISKSCHSLDELAPELNTILDYAFISPVFDSLSKPGYNTGFSSVALHSWLEENKWKLDYEVFALGGVSPKHLKALSSMGFDGAAILGGIWKEKNHLARLKAFCAYLEEAG